MSKDRKNRGNAPRLDSLFQWYIRMSAGTYRRTETTAELRRGKLARVCCQVQFVRTENSNSKEEHKSISKSITNSVVKSNKSKESWDEQIAKSDQKMDQATGLISVSESEEEKHEELATANVVENRKKDVKKAK